MLFLKGYLCNVDFSMFNPSTVRLLKKCNMNRRKIAFNHCRQLIESVYQNADWSGLTVMVSTINGLTKKKNDLKRTKLLNFLSMLFR